MHSLIVRSGKKKGKRIVLPEREVTVGRDEHCFIRMTSAEVSRQHCALIPTDRGLLVRDLGSQNGTLVNQARIEKETLLHPGDTLQVGPIVLEIEGGLAPRSPGSGMSDDDIFGWLSESDTATDMLNTSDTTIVKPTEPATVPIPQAEPKPVFKSIAEEAQDIIRRHHASRAAAPPFAG
ncbi:MAG: FHA domain-containing protein [Planctomycetales bacterium]